MKSFLDISKSLVDAELINKISSLVNYGILHSLRSDCIDRELMKVLHTHVILFLFLIGFLYFIMYFLSDVSPIQIFPSIFLAPEKPTSELCHIMSLCISLTDIWGRCFFSLPDYHYFLQTPSILHFRNLLHESNFKSRHVIH